ncbi:LPD38 domain-containing protein [Paenibacillus spongiae]|uniref:Large polyvalent protein associated domain-containing protein n=1 Tax=Paenibacillus spongiae TaxID=2909671 RepID=A0ABY5SB97_9BACL|nr:LPD38 domain-containing protein [Paenibacillus spongiae]UVI31222.1 hypothetical protein L1F29_05095 [Paenibacillus spongiae]
MSYFQKRAKELGIDVPETGKVQAGESYFQQRARELGVDLTPSPQSRSEPSQSGSDFFTQRQMELGIIPNPNANQVVEAFKENKPVTAVKNLLSNPTVQRVAGAVQEAGKAQQSRREQELIKQGMPSGVDLLRQGQQQLPEAKPMTRQEWIQSQQDRRKELNPQEGIGGWITRNIGEPLASGIDYIQAYTPGLADFQQGAGNALNIETSTAPKTGGILGKAAELGGNIAGLTTNPAALEQSLLTGPYRAAESLLATRGGQAAQRAVSRGIGRIPKVSEDAASKLAERGLTGAVAGGIQNTAISGVRGETDAGQLARAAFEGVALGAAGDLALSGLGNAVKRGVQAVRQRPLNHEIGSFIKKVETKPEKATGDWYSELFGNQGIGIIAGAKSGKTMIDTHITSRAVAPGSILEKGKQTLMDADQNFVDKFTPAKLIDKRFYDAASDTSRANNLANIAIKDKQIDLEGNVIGDSLADIYGMIPRGQKHIADRYLVLRDSVSRMDRNIRVFGDEPWFPKTSQEAAAEVAKLEERYPWLNKFGEGSNGFTRNEQNLWVRYGLESQEFVDTLRHTNPNYVPMYRQQDAMSLRTKLGRGSSGIAAKSGLSGQRAPVKRAVGSKKKIIDPLQSRIQQQGVTYNALLRNRAMMDLDDIIRANPDRFKGVIELEELSEAELNALNKLKADEGTEGIVDTLNAETAEASQRLKKKATGNGEAVTYMYNGEPRKMRIQDANMLKMIESLSPAQLNPVLQVAEHITRLIKEAATGVLAPIQGTYMFGRDLSIAAAQSKNKVRFLTDVGHAMVSQFGDWLPAFVPGAKNVGNLAREYYRAGGGYERALKGDSHIRSMSADLTKDPILSGRNMLKSVRKHNPFRPLKGFSDALENIPRIAAFAAHMRKTRWDRSSQNVRRAVEEAREATVNWSRSGYHTRSVESVAGYTNAATQGTYRFIKRWKEQPVSAAALVMANAAAMIYAYEKFKNDPDYQNRREETTSVPYAKTADGKFRVFQIDPTEAFVARQVLDFYKWAADGEKMPSGKKMVQQGLNAYLPSLASGPLSAFTTEGKAVDLKTAGVKTLGSTVLEPLSAWATSKDYGGRDIVPREYQGDPTKFQFNETTSAAGKWAAEHLGMDAFTFDYLGRKFLGDVGKIGLPATSEAGRGDVVGTIEEGILSRLKALEDPVMVNRIADDFYGYVDSVGMAKTANDRNSVPLPGYYQTVYDEVTSQKKDSLSKRISGLNAEKKAIQRDTTLNSKQRSEKLRETQVQINLLRIQGIQRMEELGVPKRKG